MNSKLKKRIWFIFLNGLKNFSPSFYAILLSIIIVRFFTPYLWGSYIKYNIFIMSVSIFHTLGSKEYLLKKYSSEPSNLKIFFSTSFFSRIPILMLCIIAGFILYPTIPFFTTAIIIISGYTCNSINTNMIYEKKFGTQIIIEFIGFLIFILCVLFSNTLNLELLLLFYATQYLLKAILYVVLERNLFLKPLPAFFSLEYIKQSLPFFFIAFIGFLNTKIDLFLVFIFEPNETIAFYQIITNLFIVIQSFSIILATPFVKQLYRLDKEPLKKIEKKVLLYSPFFIILCLLLSYLIITHIYNFESNILFYVYGFFIILPSYWLLIKYFNLYKKGQELLVFKISLKATILNLVLSFLFLKSGYGPLGIILGSAISGLSTILLFKIKKVYE
ncbi:hypothetical protein [Tenacibaculum halocynthiae]|uniref:hypothetical protein n=1 Tax=Tenacibaculum halocynthiae TaxID=1254437 RepID=UPI003D654B52